MSCLARDEGRPAVAEVTQRLRDENVRRSLAAPHVSDQVVATLNRWPTRQEWREFAVLIAWFVLILGSDWLAAQASRLTPQVWDWRSGPASATPLLTWLTTGAWLMQGIARAGFFASFFTSLWRAWRIGGGVCLARILQLKLIHTVLVIAATMILGQVLSSLFPNYTSSVVDWPQWLQAPFIALAVLALSALVWAITKGKYWSVALGGVLLAVFLYPTGPRSVVLCSVESPIFAKYIRGGTEGIDRVALDDPAQIAAWKEKHDWFNPDDYTPAQLAANRSVTVHSDGTYYPLHLNGGRTDWITEEQRQYAHRIARGEWSSDRLVGERQAMYTPIAVPGAGLGWLAVPIPLLGIIGLVGMAMLMGRRGFAEAVGYALICFVAIASTLLPFFFSGYDGIFDFTPGAVAHTPFPGFETLLCGGSFEDNALLILGLVLSAGMPWLLTGLFLKPKRNTPDEQSPAITA